MTAPASERVRELVAEIRDDVADDRGRDWTVLHLSMAAVDDLLAAAGAWADAQDFQRTKLEALGLWDEFGKWGCDTVEQLGEALIEARARIAELEAELNDEKSARTMDRYGMQDGSLLRDLRAHIAQLEAERNRERSRADEYRAELDEQDATIRRLQDERDDLRRKHDALTRLCCNPENEDA